MTIQNALDEEATKVWVTINRRARNLTISDNGLGKNQKEFEKALRSVCQSVKDSSKMGRFGVGLIAPLGKCERYTFLSTPKDEPRGFIEWTFVTDEIRAQRVVSGIPRAARTDLVFELQGRHGQQRVPWRTEMRIENFTTDRMISRISGESLKAEILDRYSPVMRKYETVVSIRIKDLDGRDLPPLVFSAKPFEGEPLEVQTITDLDAGPTIFELYIARKTAKGRKGQVTVGEVGNDYRINFATFARSVNDWLPLSEEVISVFTSGIFEGQILSTNAKFHPNRKGFEKNDALTGLCACIDAWFRKVGHQHFQEVREARQERRYQELGIQSMRVIDAVLKNPAFKDLLEVVKSFGKGTVGVGHTEPPKEIVEGVQQESSLSIEGPSLQPKPRKNGDNHPKGTPEKDKKAHVPLTVTGPHGKQRVTVRSDSSGLQFLFDSMSGSSKAWELEIETGILRFNVRHPLWEQCERNDKTLMRYIEYVAIQAVTFHTIPLNWAEVVGIAYDDLLKAYVFTLLHADEVAKRRRVPTKKQSPKN
ncbi:MAG: ATP-binding protein [Parcubacteria group bacterium]|nr:ATP-binding protein [Parcubacteria group bacterium]